MVDYEPQFSTCINKQCSISFMDVIVPHLVFYLFWQTCYLIKTEYIDKDIMDKRKDLQTSFRWLSNKDKKSTSYKIINCMGSKFKIVMFTCMQCTYHLLTVIPVKLCYDYQWFHTLLIFLVFGQCVYNGASFYFSNTFYREYLQRLESMTKALEQQKESMEQKE